jgi:hypothetical protein
MKFKDTDALFFQKTRGRIRRAEMHLRQMEKIAAWQARRTILAEERYAEPGRLPRHGYKVYSQTDEDGIIAEIFRRIGTEVRAFIEIGAGDGLENNTANLLLQGWQGAWIETNPRRYRVIEERHRRALADGRLVLGTTRITPDNVKPEIAKLTGDQKVDLLSLDIDGNDYHVLEALDDLGSRVVVVEYNPKHRPPTVWVMNYDPAHVWDGTDHYGASLSAYAELMAKRGYALVGCGITGNNAYFVREDLCGERFCAPFTAENHYEPARFWLVPGFESGHPPGLRGS